MCLLKKREKKKAYVLQKRAILVEEKKIARTINARLEK